ncbi:VOC family protein [Granulicella cerasi]|uniref:VOC family protein n=1 Tax=Granulicella cerasi TaxID=741063 RepID=A0ABW1ZAD6_9BACT|nr:VOC family protein [Granulicella cerasi]
MSRFESNAVTWFEIPTSDFERATKFYEHVLDIKFIPFGDGDPINIFPSVGAGATGCITKRPHGKPSVDGTRVFLNADGKLDASIKRAEKLGATIVTPRTQIPNGSYYACLIDSEGNHVGLHSSQF